MVFLPKWEAIRGLSTADAKEAFPLLSPWKWKYSETYRC